MMRSVKRAEDAVKNQCLINKQDDPNERIERLKNVESAFGNKKRNKAENNTDDLNDGVNHAVIAVVFTFSQKLLISNFAKNIGRKDRAPCHPAMPEPSALSDRVKRIGMETIQCNAKQEERDK